MTSEIAVMNQRAVALAADSAVTLVDGSTVAVRNDQRKLFQLVDGRTIGAMYFGIADIMGHPWEHLIEHYQGKVQPRAFAHVGEYAESFVAMLDDLPEFFPQDRQKDDFKRLLAAVYRYIFHLAQQSRDGSGAADDTQLLDDAIERVWRDYQFREDGRPRPDLACFPSGFATRILREHSQTIEELIAFGFQPFSLGKTAIQRLRDIAVFAVIKDLFLEDVTGIVFAGFGTRDHYPVAVTYYVSAIVCGIVKRSQASHDAIDGATRSKIRVFADSEVTNAFIRGIDYNLEGRVYGGVRTMLSGLVDQVVASFPGASAKSRENVRRHAQDQLVPQYFEYFRGMAGEFQQQKFINPVLRVLEIASRSELGETARELISLNAFKKRIMAQKQTVGGAIDVAVISRESGFQWYTRQDRGKVHG